MKVVNRKAADLIQIVSIHLVIWMMITQMKKKKKVLIENLLERNLPETTKYCSRMKNIEIIIIIYLMFL